jgi:uncharacterized protein YdhG (YjbR/CyaY superfamily)
MATSSTKKPAAKSTRTRTVADYLRAAPKDRRAGLMQLRKTIKAAAPKATEAISYDIGVFKHKGKPVVFYAYWKDHFSLYGMGRNFIDAHAAELKAFGLSKGTIRFPADKPLPERLVTKIVKARIAEIEKAS